MRPENRRWRRHTGRRRAAQLGPAVALGRPELGHAGARARGLNRGRGRGKCAWHGRLGGGRWTPCCVLHGHGGGAGSDGPGMGWRMATAGWAAGPEEHLAAKAKEFGGALLDF
jgi:hypothetical protein